MSSLSVPPAGTPPPQRPSRPLPAEGRRHHVQLVKVVKHVVGDAHSKPRVVYTFSRLKENASLFEDPEAPLHSSIATLDVLAHALQPSAPGMLLDCGMVLDWWHEQRNLVCAATRDMVGGI